MQVESVKDANGRPPNMVPPRNSWIHVFSRTDWPWWKVRIEVHHQSYASMRPAFSGGAFIHAWWSWYVGVNVGGGMLQVWRWRERWAV